METDNRKYYAAYNERYKTAHAQGVLLIFQLSLTSLSMELNLVIIRLPHISVKGIFPFL